MTAEAAFDTPGYQATSVKLSRAGLDRAPADGIITVITDDASYDLKATGWVISEHGQLDIMNAGHEPVATFAPTKWIGVWQATATAESVPAAT